MGKLLWNEQAICLFCTEKQVSVCQFRQFCILTKISIEISWRFVYNVCIAVLCTGEQEEEGNTLPERRL